MISDVIKDGALVAGKGRQATLVLLRCINSSSSLQCKRITNSFVVKEDARLRELVVLIEKISSDAASKKALEHGARSSLRV